MPSARGRCRTRRTFQSAEDTDKSFGDILSVNYQSRWQWYENQTIQPRTEDDTEIIPSELIDVRVAREKDGFGDVFAIYSTTVATSWRTRTT